MSYGGENNGVANNVCGSEERWPLLRFVFPDNVLGMIAAFSTTRCVWCDVRHGILVKVKEKGGYDWEWIDCFFRTRGETDEPVVPKPDWIFIDCHNGTRDETGELAVVDRSVTGAPAAESTAAAQDYRAVTGVATILKGLG